MGLLPNALPYRVTDMLTAEPILSPATEASATKASTAACRPKRSAHSGGETSRFPRRIGTPDRSVIDPLATRLRQPPSEHPLQRLDLCRIAKQGRISAALASFVHALLTKAGRRPALLTPEGGLIAGRLFPQRPTISDAPEWERLLATHVRSGGDCLITEEDAEIQELLSGVTARSDFQQPSTPRLWIQPQALHWRGSRLQVLSTDGTARMAHLPLVGGSNLKALDLALNLVINAGCCPTQSLATLPLLEAPTGLLEPVHAGQPYGVFVDRAASAADLTELLDEARTLSGRRILLVVGIRGSTTLEERQAMGAAAALADEVVFTSDNPRHVPVPAILADLQSGLGGKAIEEPDRHTAITTAIRMAKSDDLVLIVGKGGKPLQEIGGAVIPWDDRMHALDALAGRGWVGDSL